MFAVMGAFLVAALATPQAFGDDALLFGARLRRRALAAHLHLRRGQRGRGHRRRRSRAWPARHYPGPALLIAAGFDRRDAPGRALDRGAGDRLLGSVRVRRARLPRLAGPLRRALLADRDHRAGRVDRGDRGRARAATSTRGMIVAALLGLVLACALWWAYFDVVALVAEDRFREAPGHELVRIARDSYSYLHLPMIAGIVLVALGVKKTIGARGRAARDRAGGGAVRRRGALLRRPRGLPPAEGRHVNRPRLIAALLCLALIPLGTEVDALVALALAAAVASAVIAYEARALSPRAAAAHARRRALGPGSIHRLVTRAGISRRNVLGMAGSIPSDRPECAGRRRHRGPPGEAVGARPTTAS